MAVCLLLRQKSYAFQKYLCVLTIVAGVVVFLYNPKKAGSEGLGFMHLHQGKYNLEYYLNCQIGATQFSKSTK